MLIHSSGPLPEVSRTFDRKAVITMLFTRVRYELKGILKSPTFIVLMLAGLMNFIPNLLSASGPFGLTAHPVTNYMIDMIQGAFYSFLIAIVIIYSGLLVWRERESKFDEIYDATPHPTWISYTSKFITMAVVIMVIQVVCILASMIVQFAKGFTDVRPEVYITSLLVLDYVGMLLLVIMAMFLHSVINNKYIAFFAFVIFLLANNFVWIMLEIESNMVQYGGKPSFIYSDMNGYGPYISGLSWFRLYWGLIAIVVALISISIWNRGKETSFQNKLKLLTGDLKGKQGKIVGAVLVIWILTAGFVYYNTQLLNKYETTDESESLQVEYEKKFKKYENIVQPRITDLKYTIDLYPDSRKAEIKGTWWIKNKSNVSIDSVHLVLPENFKVTIDIAGAKLVDDHKKLHYRIYRLEKPMMPDDSMQLTFTSVYSAKGYENEVRFNSIVDNGSFFNNLDFSPQIGYQPGGELQDRDERKKRGLKEIDRMPPLERNCTEHCYNNYLTNHSDWVNVETIFSTNGDQIAVAPGSLVKQWNKDGRNYFHYKLDHPSLNFYSFISARYQVLRVQHRGINVEVYYDANILTTLIK